MKPEFAVLVLIHLAVFFSVSQLRAEALSIENFPTLTGENLLKETFQFPKDLKGDTILIVLGFTKGSDQATRRCVKALEPLFENRKNHESYSIAMIQGAPFFVKGMIKNSIREKTDIKKRSHFIILDEGRKDLEGLSAFDKNFEDDAYILGLKKTESGKYGRVFTNHTTCEPASLSPIDKSLRDALWTHH